jgi:hypothetical protein|tara:strand:- start:1935 stop:3236 length:1302 start_codon:yes stop_codon:yes gene_type:complete
MNNKRLYACYWLIGLSTQTWAQSNIPDDPFTNIQQNSPAQYEHKTTIQTYLQTNKINNKQSFNPGLVAFTQNKQSAVLDWQVKTHWQSNFQGRARTIAQYQHTDIQKNTDIPSNADTSNNLDTTVLEAYLNWTSNDYAWQWQLGRIKTQWSTGFNWNLTNLLKPYRDRPYIDLDDPKQQKGWDMATVKYSQNNWFYHLVIADSVTANKKNKQQYIARLGFQGSHDFVFLLHKQPEQSLNYAASFNRLLTDEITMRFEWSLLQQREQKTQALLGENESTQWQKYLVGAGYTLDSGHDFRIEYLNTKHGFTNDEWTKISNKSSTAYQNIINNQPREQDHAYLFSALNSLNLGQLRQNYLYFMYASPLSTDLWQYRQSIQLNLNDNSELHRLELLKSWNNHLTSRLQLEFFNGCRHCEYGLNPNLHSMRLVFNWAF